MGTKGPYLLCRGGGIAGALEGARMHARYGEIANLETCVDKARALAARTVGFIVQGPLIEATRQALIYRGLIQRGKRAVAEARDMARGGMLSEVERQLSLVRESALRTGSPLTYFLSRAQRARIIRRVLDESRHVLRSAAHAGDAEFVFDELRAMKRLARSLRWSVRVFLSRVEEKRTVRRACRAWARNQRTERYEHYRDLEDYAVGPFLRTASVCARRLHQTPHKLLGSELMNEVMARYHYRRAAAHMADQVWRAVMERLFPFASKNKA